MWVSWANGYIEAGKGTLVGDEPFVSWNSGVPQMINPVNAVGLSTAVEAEGTFMFGNIEGKTIDELLESRVICKFQFTE